MQLVSWVNDRLPEMLWATILIVAFGRSTGLDLFRRIIDFIARHENKEHLFDLTLSGISRLESEMRIELIKFIAEPPEIAEALSTLLYFDALPAREDWRQNLPSLEPDVDLLMTSVGASLWHQSQEATDCRWLRLMGYVAARKLVGLPQMVDGWIKYPGEQDQQTVEPSVRAAELVLNSSDQPDMTWPRAFWRESWTKTSCIELNGSDGQFLPDAVVTRQAITELGKRLNDHWSLTHDLREIDAKHDGVFGMAFYCLRILEEMMTIGIDTSVLGRLGLRTILEVRINLKHLLSEDNVELWKTWREYGAGQAKLNALKFDSTIDSPKFIDVESIENIASEDVWEEFVTVNLAGWSGLDLRKISDRVGLKNTYDQYYSWTSGYAHGMWGPIRESTFQVCGNPLHRLHRYPERQTLQDTVDDAALLVDEIIGHVDEAYPSFKWRLVGREEVEKCIETSADVSHSGVGE